MTNQRTGVAVNVSASDDSQSQPSKTPPYSGSVTMAMSGSAQVTAETKTVPSANAAPTRTSFSMDSILSDVISKQFPPNKEGSESEDTKGGIISKLDEIEAKQEKSTETSKSAQEVETSKSKEEIQKDNQECEKQMDTSVEILDVVETRKKSDSDATETQDKTSDNNLLSPNEALDVSLEIIDYIVGNAVEAKEKTKISNISQDIEDLPPEKSESESLALALVEELRMLTGDQSEEPSAVKKENDTLTRDSTRQSSSVEVVPKTEIKQEISSDIKSDQDIKATNSETEKNVDVKEEEKKDAESKKAEKEEDKEDLSQDSTAAALERLTSELMFLNESLCESQTDSQNESMEWSDAVDKDSKPNNKEGDQKEDIAKTDLKKESQQDDSVEFLDTEEHVDRPGEAKKTENMEKKSVTKGLTQEDNEEPKDGKIPDLEKVAAEEHCRLKTSSSTGFVPQEKIKPSSDNRTEMSSRKEDDSKPEGIKDKSEIQYESNKSEKITIERKEGEAEHESLIDAETGEILDPKKLKELEMDIEKHKTSVATEPMKTGSVTTTQEKSSISKNSTSEKDAKVYLTDGKTRLSPAQEKELLDLCHSGFSLCLKRFAQHFKSIYRLAYIHYHSKQHKVNLLS